MISLEDTLQTLGEEVQMLRKENDRLRERIQILDRGEAPALAAAMRALEQSRAEVARLTKAITFEQHWLERIGTHGPGCYQWGPSHWLCAVNEIKRLAALRGEGE